MELKKRIDLKRLFLVIFGVMFAMFILIGMIPVEAVVNYDVSANLNIPSIGLSTDVTTLELNDDTLDTPDTIVGSYSEAKNKTLLIGHSSTVFANLHDTKIGDEIIYDGAKYSVVSERLAVKDVINMDEILAPAPEDTLVIMTCAGMNLGGHDATHRLIITAKAE